MRIAAAGLFAVLAIAPALQAQDPLLPARTKGLSTAPIVVYEMSDFQCPWCRRHALETWPVLLKEYVETGKVRWTFINFPLTQLHPNAAAAAEFAMCAAQEGAFWRIHDLLYLYQDKWGPLKDPAPFLITFADSAGLQRGRLTTCLTSGVMRPVVQADAVGASRAGAASTPSFYIEGGILPGFQPPAVWRQILDSIYAEKTARK
jgi:protein-disulfide isomerase